MSKVLIYGLKCTCCPGEGVRYVGQTKKGVKARLGVHLWNARSKESKSYNTYIYNWIRKHGVENIVHEVLEECTEGELDSKEVYWITKLSKEGCNLTNVRPGGFSESGYKNPRQSENMRGEKNPMFGKDRREAMAYARSFQGPMSEENKKRMSKRVKGEGNPRAKLTEDDVRTIKGKPGYYGINSDLAREYGVSAANISGIRLGKYWTHLKD